MLERAAIKVAAGVQAKRGTDPNGVQAKRGAAEALHSLCMDTQATQQMMESGLLPCLQPMLEWESDIYGRDAALTLLVRPGCHCSSS